MKKTKYGDSLALIFGLILFVIGVATAVVFGGTDDLRKECEGIQGAKYVQLESEWVCIKVIPLK